MLRSKVLAFVCGLLFPLLLVGCDSLTGITEMNEDPSTVTDLDIETRYTDLPLAIPSGRFANWRTNLIHGECIAQHLASTTTAWSGCRYTLNNAYATSYWNRKWTPLRQFEDVIADSEPAENPELTNIHAQATILRTFLLHRMTDVFGNIPYEDAGKGVTEGVTEPEYQAVQDIYPAMIEDLQEARGQLDPSVNTLEPGRDLVYGDRSNRIETWRRFANSMILRLGMRMSEVAPGQAEDAVRDAIDNGVMESNDNTAWLQLVETNGKTSGIGQVFNDFGTVGHGFRISKTFMDILKGNAGPTSMTDPRTSILTGQFDDEGNLVTNDPAQLEGLTNGLSAEEIPDDPFTRAMPNYDFMVRYDSPVILQGYAEVKFLEAEAALRGWHPDNSDAQVHYEEGIRAAMKQLTIYGAPEIPDGEIDSYIDSLDPLPVSADPNGALERIIEQKWVHLFLNGHESWAELRRTRYPDDVEPIDFPGNRTNGEFPSRLLYPSGEQEVNGENFQSGATLPNQLSTSLWWETGEEATVQ